MSRAARFFLVDAEITFVRLEALAATFNFVFLDVFAIAQDPDQ